MQNSEQASYHTQPIKTSNSFNAKHLIFAITITALICGVGGYLFEHRPIMPTAGQVSTWETYTNATYGYAIQYPSNLLSIAPQKKDDTYILGVDRYICIDIPEISCGMMISVIPNFNNKSLEQISKEASMSSTKQTTNGQEWAFYDVPAEPGYPGRYYITLHGSNIYTIKAVIDTKEDKDLLNQVLSTFKFIK